MTLSLILGALLAVLCVVFAARAFLCEPQVPAEADRLDAPGPLGQRQLELAEERDRALAALKELEFDHRTGKVSDDDYRELVGPLRRAAAEALRALEPRAGASTAEADDALAFAAVSEQPPVVPEPTPVPHEPPQRPDVPEPYPPPATPPEPAPVPEPWPVPHEPPDPRAPDAA